VTAIERTVAFVLADLAGYVALTEAHGNAEAAGVIERFVAVARASLAPGARLVERVGDQVVVAADDLARRSRRRCDRCRARRASRCFR